MARRAKTAAARREAKALLDLHGGRTNVTRNRKVLPEALAELLGLTVEYEALEDEVSGLCILQDDGAHIVINSRHHSNRQRFSLAHEIAHYALHSKNTEVASFIDAHGKHSRRLMRDGTAALGTEPMEIEANAFAAELLMPSEAVTWEFRAMVRNRFVEDEDIARMARKFGVSQRAMTIRLMSLELI